MNSFNGRFMENEIEKESKITPIDGGTFANEELQKLSLSLGEMGRTIALIENSTPADEELKQQLALKLSEICNNLNL